MPLMAVHEDRRPGNFALRTNFSLTYRPGGSNSYARHLKEGPKSRSKMAL